MSNIDMQRTLVRKHEQRHVLNRFLTWAKARGMERYDDGTQSISELRWSDDYRQLYVRKESRFMRYFESMYPEHQPLVENHLWAIYDDCNPAASVLLAAIHHEITRGE